MPLLAFAMAMPSVAAEILPQQQDDLLGGIVGRVCLDTDGDGRCGDSEQGLSGLRVVLETGQYAVSDGEGRFHMAGVETRRPDSLGGGRLWQGRHRIAVDPRTLPAGSQVAPSGATLELSMGGLAIQDFAVQQQAEAPLRSAFVRSPAVATVENGDRVLFFLSGAARPDQKVEVQGHLAERLSDGTFRAQVNLSKGKNQVPITLTDPDGRVGLWTQRIDVVSRKQSLLVIPNAPQTSGSVSFSQTDSDGVVVRAAVGTRVQVGGGEEQTVGKDGQLRVIVHPDRLQRPDIGSEVTVRLQVPGQQPREERLVPQWRSSAFVVGLLDLEATYDVRSGAPRLFGRGALHGEARHGPWLVEGELDFRDQDVRDLKGGVNILVAPRRIDRFDRWLDPESNPTQWGDDSVGVVPNPEEGRIRVRAAHETFGDIGFGTHRALFQDGEIGRYQRAVFGPYVDLKSPDLGPVRLGLNGFFAPDQVDPLLGISTFPLHEEFRATGGSLFYLNKGGVTQGSEIVRLVYRDGTTSLPLGEAHLSRGVDYEIDYVSGRIILARALSFALGVPKDASAPFMSQPLSDRVDSVLVVDCESLGGSSNGRRTGGGELKISAGSWRINAGAVQESGASLYELYRANASGKVGPLTLLLEGARSRGNAIGPSSYGLSTDGGLTFIRPLENLGDGYAVTARVRGTGITQRGRLEAAFRLRSAGFSDGAHYDVAGERRITLFWEEPLGPVNVGILADDRHILGDVNAFRSDITQLQVGDSRTFGGHLGTRVGRFDARVEAKDQELTASGQQGGRTSAGLMLRYRLNDTVSLLASHHQVLAKRGTGAGRFDDTLTAAGAEVALPKDAMVGAQVGWGPTLGVVALASGQVRSGKDVHYGSYSVDVDGPNAGERRLTSGAKTDISPNGAIFTEDVAAYDATSLRLSRAAGASIEVLKGLSISGRYERGQLTPFGTTLSVQREAGGLSASWVRDRLRLYGRGEIRSSAASATQPSVLQRLASGAADYKFTDRISATGRINASDSVSNGVTVAHLLEASAGAAYRSQVFALVASYGITQELLPPEQGGGPQRSVQSVSLLPAVKLHKRFSLSAGGHLGRVNEAGRSFWILSGSIRPGVQVWHGVEVAAEFARRTANMDGGDLSALRGEVGYRMTGGMLLAAGYSFFGFRGTGLEFGTAQNRDRIYVRAEMGF